MNIVILDDWEQVFTRSVEIQGLKSVHNVTIYSDHIKEESILVERLKNAEIIVPIRERTAFPKNLLEELPKLEFIVQTGTGMAHIDLQYAEQKGIQICNMPGISSTSVMELTIAFILSCLRRLPEHREAMISGEWVQSYGKELKGKTVGIIGFGEIGKSVARVLQAFEARVIAWSPSLTAEKALSAGVEAAGLEQLLEQSDIVSLHIRAVPSFRHILDRGRLAGMKRGAILINTSRAMLIDMKAVYELLEIGYLSAGAFDVFDIEPLPSDDPIRRLPNVTLTSHIGWVTEELLEQFAKEAALRIQQYVQN